jgi:hypothetical protein
MFEQKSKDDPDRIKVQGESERATSHFHNALLLSRSTIEVTPFSFADHKYFNLPFRRPLARGEVCAPSPPLCRPRV